MPRPNAQAVGQRRIERNRKADSPLENILLFYIDDVASHAFNPLPSTIWRIGYITVLGLVDVIDPYR